MATLGYSLSQQQRQIMTLAPQMCQSLEILQKPVTEVQAIIYQEMAQNPTIEDIDQPVESLLSDVEHPEMATGETEDAPEDFDDAVDSHVMENLPPLPHTTSTPDTDALPASPDIDAALGENAEWRDYFMQGMENADMSEEAQTRRQRMFDSLTRSESLQEHLLEQLDLLALSPADKEIAELLIGNINDKGYFTGSIPDIAMTCNHTLAHVNALLDRIQTFDPPGVGARTPRECLLAQAERLDDSPWENEVRTVIDRYLPEVAAHNEKKLCHMLKLSPDELEHVLSILRSFAPYPGYAFVARPQPYVEPEVFVEWIHGKLVARVDDRPLPRIRISPRYIEQAKDPTTPPEVRAYLQEKLKAGNVLIESLKQRQETIRKIAQGIVDAQISFFTKGVAALQPLTMAVIAAQAGVHETTVSRTVRDKYMRTPRGVFEMRSFFTTGLATQSGELVSNRSIQHKIKTIIANEDPRKPLSDQAIEALLAKDGLNVARRTVAKYRTLLKIPSTHDRRIK